MISVASWNVNSVRARVKLIDDWLNLTHMDILAMQETKVEDKLFPLDNFKSIGYNCSFFGQKAYNGVAICSKQKPVSVLKGWPDGENNEKRIIVAKFDKLTVVDVYVPRGGKDGTEKHAYKLYFLAKLKAFLLDNFSPSDPICVVGDMNVALEDIDVYDPVVWRNRPGFMDTERSAFKDLLSFGLYDIYREKHKGKKQFTWWDIESGGFGRNRGLRIDYILATKPLLDKCLKVDVDTRPRAVKKPMPSDHAPIYAVFDI